MQQKHFEVVIVGAGISGTALFYELAAFTDIKRVALLEKYEGVATLNSNGRCNSQTIHCGDIETNYTLEKAKRVNKVAKMPIKYGLKYGYEGKFMFSHQKMVLAVGDEEVQKLTARYGEFKEVFPYLELYSKEDLKQIEPNVVFDINANPRSENIVAMGTKEGQYTTVDFGAMSDSLVKNAQKIGGDGYELSLNCNVLDIKKVGDTFYLKTSDSQSISADYVVVDAGAHSLYLAHKMGYGMHLSTLPVAGSFYFAKKNFLKGKVYMMQNDKLPFAALHGDPDILANGNTRFGPTALVMPKLERYHGNSSFFEFLSALKFDRNVLEVFVNLMKDEDIRSYVLRNFLFEIPFINKKEFVKDARKIVPSLREDDLFYAKNFGGVRPQVVDRLNKKLDLGEGRISTNDGISFNMTPSPGATSCFETARVDLEQICKFLNKNFDKEKFKEEFLD
ncbi:MULTISPECIES: FAD-dependent oxidoreductase [Campylobacter]|uniref:malate dehydrogenase (quinone) n=1 Tax=Campylobacter californiensis TaxID=1032243 RepID=A0ABD4JHG0_9BACT|nr:MULTISPECIES: FAD-dependent oxidoreductase [unclassified Campylobacter]MBE2986180.1 FAD-dependent oxidoreductase [Campylobacter sp. RM12919]MBE2988177.1 FAD-dependent oxidoreductase [Campylobacter sp. RM12920]MBE3022665.1 FAD-dependent oxidoreductase [Campylobacter sp. 7477a]MBE3609574.1 FAD-dependent oxidoreductase [Campylobacter sp. RM12916]